MAAITFPASPTTNQVFADGTSAWQWDGTAWRVVRNSLFQTQLQYGSINFNGASLTDALFLNGSLYPSGTNATYPRMTFNGLYVTTDSNPNSANPNSNRWFIGFRNYKTPDTTNANFVIGDSTALNAGTTNNSANGNNFGNLAIGYGVLSNLLTGNQNLGIGNYAMQSASSGMSSCIGVGEYALQNCTGALWNIALGQSAGQSISFWTNVAIGNNACQTASGNNTAVGYQALYSYNGGYSNNTAVGYNALYGINANTNTALGYSAGSNITTGTNNVFLGYQSGTDALINVTTQNNVVVLGNASTASLYCKTSTISTSDVRDKTNIRPVTLGLDFVNAIEPIAYQFKTSRQDPTPSSRVYLGWRAQDVLANQGFESIVDDHDPENLKLAGMDMVAVLWNAVQELSAEVQQLKAKLGE